jgi:hypothetical protein
VPELTLGIDVAAPVEQTWAALTDWPRQSAWMLGTRVEPGERGGHGVGGTIRAWSGIGPFGFWDTMAITAWEPPHRCDVVHTGRLVRGTGSFTVSTGRGGSRLVWSEQLDLPLGPIGRIGWLLARSAFAAGVRLSLRRFARFAQAYA